MNLEYFWRSLGQNYLTRGISNEPNQHIPSLHRDPKKLTGPIAHVGTGLQKTKKRFMSYTVLHYNEHASFMWPLLGINNCVPIFFF